ncbi:hypothetical protein ABF87_04295 [Nitrosomonas sp. JL21]|uniref:hypothetical protein n=1 Tax=Nitrosomonas sp. JL21 TaxID=153949 RepID=UPI00136F1F85|nr:hypothetical protein [Nitrosomonas sp. JL21]MBL8497324.1 hypothetical protein [Nitrosomonas sp.]MXS77193.1 hypothetical protein [Nitrosomonas sp. JL21]
MQTPTKKPHPAGVTAYQNSRVNYNIHNPLTEVESRLNGVVKRQKGGLLAFCPSHDDRKGRSLAVSTGREGQVLMHCFAGCSIHEITQAIDLNPADLFPRSDNQNYDPQTRSYFSDWQTLSALRYDALVVLSAARTMLRGEKLAESDVTFLSGAVIRINEAASYSRGARHE